MTSRLPEITILCGLAFDDISTNKEEKATALIAAEESYRLFYRMV